MNKMHVFRVFGAWKAGGLLAVLLLACLRCASLHTEAGVTEAQDEVFEEPPYSIHFNSDARKIRVYIERCLEKAEQEELVAMSLASYRGMFAKQIENLEKTEQHALALVRAGGASALCQGTCCADVALCILGAIAGIEGLEVSMLTICGFVSETEYVMPRGLPSFLCGVFVFPLTVQMCVLRDVSSYLFHGVSKLLQVAPSEEPGEKSFVTIENVVSVDFEHCPPAHSWDVSVLSFFGVEDLNLGSAVATHPQSTESGSEEHEWQTQKSVRVREKLEITGSLTRLAMQSVLLGVPRLGVALKVAVQEIALCVWPLESSALLAREIHAVVAHMKGASVFAPWVSLVVGQRRGAFSAAAREGLQRELFWVHEERNVPLGMLQDCTLDVRETHDAAPFLYVHVGRHSPTTSIPWAIQLPSAVLRSGEETAQAIRALSAHMPNAAVECAVTVLQSLLLEGENAGLLAKMEALPSQMTLLPCGCFWEKEWNALWHTACETDAEFDAEYAAHFATHRGHYPMIALELSGPGTQMSLAEPLVVCWESTQLAEDAEEKALQNTGYTLKIDEQSLFIEVVPVDASLHSPASFHRVKQIEERFVPTIRALVLHNAAVDRFDMVSIKGAAGVPLPLYRYLSMRFLDALAICRVCAYYLDVRHGKEVFSSVSYTPYQCAIMARLCCCRHEEERLDARVFAIGAEFVEDLTWIADPVTVGTPDAPGALDIVLESAITIHMWMRDGRIAEVRIPEIEDVIEVGNWCVGVLAVCAPHAVVLHRNAMLALPSLSIHAHTKLIISGVPVFVSPEAASEYFEWCETSGVGLCTETEKNAEGFSEISYTPIKSEAHVLDIDIGAHSRKTFSCIRKYIEGMACTKAGAKVKKITFYVEELGKALAPVAHGNRFCPAIFRETWTETLPGGLEVFLQKHTLGVSALGAPEPSNQVCLFCLPTLASLEEY